MTSVKWSKLVAGDSVILDGVEYSVKLARAVEGGTKVMLTNRVGGFHSGVMKGKVEIGDPSVAAKAHPALPARESKAKGKKGKPAKKSRPAGWNEVTDAAEKNVVEILGGKLAEVHAGGVRYVPPVDVSTIKAHLLIFHDLDSDARTGPQLLELHEAEHAAKRGKDLHVDHTHKKNRPTS